MLSGVYAGVIFAKKFPGKLGGRNFKGEQRSTPIGSDQPLATTKKPTNRRHPVRDSSHPSDFFSLEISTCVYFPLGKISAFHDFCPEISTCDDLSPEIPIYYFSELLMYRNHYSW